ncbi:MAG: membrane dipeptidase [Chloroflexi bacterium]|nr:membrane dipeptidase [Chloroflexota bacterium]
MREPEEAAYWYECGLRAIGLAWDDTRYATGGWSYPDEGMTAAGYRLLEVMADIGFILDLTHMSEKSTIQALERYEGVVVATHSNCRELVPGGRQLSDTQIHMIGERDGVIGTALFNSFLLKGWRKGGSQKKRLRWIRWWPISTMYANCWAAPALAVLVPTWMAALAANISPAELDTSADLHKIGAKLAERGYEPADVALIMGGNWLRVLRTAVAP